MYGYVTGYGNHMCLCAKGGRTYCKQIISARKACKPVFSCVINCFIIVITLLLPVQIVALLAETRLTVGVAFTITVTVGFVPAKEVHPEALAPLMV